MNGNVYLKHNFYRIDNLITITTHIMLRNQVLNWVNVLVKATFIFKI